MPCARCGVDEETRRGRFCAKCEREYDGWVRQYAGDIVGIVLAGGGVLLCAAILVPILGLPWLFTASGAVLGWATIFAGFARNSRRRRRQFLAGNLPRAQIAPKP